MHTHVYAQLRFTNAPLPPPQPASYEDEAEAMEDESLKEMVELAVQRLYDALNPVI